MFYKQSFPQEVTFLKKKKSVNPQQHNRYKINWTRVSNNDNFPFNCSGYPYTSLHKDINIPITLNLLNREGSVPWTGYDISLESLRFNLVSQLQWNRAWQVIKKIFLSIILNCAAKKAHQMVTKFYWIPVRCYQCTTTMKGTYRIREPSTQLALVA